MPNYSPDHRNISRLPYSDLLIIWLLSVALCSSAASQTTPTQAPGQTPKTAPQTAQILPAYEGQNVSSVELAGRPDLNTDRFLPLLAQQEGQPFSQAKVEESMAALKNTHEFQDVQIDVRPEPNGIRVLFVLQPATYYGIYDFPGATERFSYTRLLQVANYPPRGSYTASDMKQAQEALVKFFKRTGYFLAEVKPEVQVDAKHGLANIIFHVTLNRRAKFGNVGISGASPDETRRLQGVLRSWMARLRGSAIRPGKTYRLKTLQNATQYLENSLTKRDHLGAEVRLIGATYNPETNRADVTFNVQPGPLVHVKVEGAHLWSWKRHKLLPVYQQIGVNPELIQEGRQNLISYFQSKGYFETKVTVQQQQQPSGETLLYQITKGPRYKVGEVEIKGNAHLREGELLPSVTVQEAHFLSHGKYSQQLLQKSIKNLTGLYQAAGFSDVKVTPQVTTHDGKLTVVFQVEEGPRDIVQDLRIDGNHSLSVEQLAPRGLKLAPGQPYSQNSGEQDRNQIMASYLRLGYLTATFRETARKLPNQPHRLEVVYNIYEGPQVHTATLVTLGRKDTKPRLIGRNLAGIQQGHPLTADDLLESQSRLYTLGVFDWAEVSPRRQITTQTQEDVIVKVHESKQNVMTYGFGFDVINRGGNVPSGTVAVPGLPPVGLPSTFKTSEKRFWGPRGSFEYTRKNLGGKAEALTLSALAARLIQRGSVIYADPNFRWSKWNSTSSFLAEHNEENPIFTSRQIQLSFQLQRPLDEPKTRNVFLRYSLSKTDISNLLIPDLVPPDDQHVRLSTVSGSFIRDTRDSILDAHKGIYESLQLDLNAVALGSSVDFVKLLGQVAYYKKIPANIIWANSFRLGLEQPFAGSHVPLSEEFFSGGGSTLRGFPLNAAGPQNTIPACGNPTDPSTCSLITVPIGGNELVILNSELRIPVPIKKGLGIAAFYDGGNVYERVGFHAFGADYTNSIGLGLRYATPVGPIRIDVGHNLNPVPGIKSTQIFITLGQAF